MNLIPAIDLINNRCVRLQQGNYTQLTVYPASPLDMARQFEAEGFQYLHMVDLQGAHAQRIIHQNILQQIAAGTSLHIDFSGGLRTDDDLKRAFDNGACKVTIGSMAIENPEKVYTWLSHYGPERIILGADVQEDIIMTRGWQQSGIMSVYQLLDQYLKYGVGEVMCTDTGKDGMLQGPATLLYQRLLQRYNISLIASGGVASVADLIALQQAGCSGAIIGKALYEGYIKAEELVTFMQYKNETDA